MEQNRKTSIDFYPFDDESKDRRKFSRFQFNGFCKMQVRLTGVTVFARAQNIDRGGLQVVLDSEPGSVPFYVDIEIPLINSGELRVTGYIDTPPDAGETGYVYRIKFVDVSAEQQSALEQLFESLTAIVDRRERQRAHEAVDVNRTGYRHIRHKTKVVNYKDRRKASRRIINQAVGEPDRRSRDRRIGDRRSKEVQIQYVDWTIKPHLVNSAEKLLRFYRKTNFVYRDKLEFLLPVKDEVVETVNKLLACRDKTCRYVFVTDGDEIMGSVMAVQYTNDTWMVQHIVTLPGNTLLAKELVLEILGWSVNNREMRHFLNFYQSKTRWAYKTYHSVMERFAHKGVGEDECEYVYKMLGSEEDRDVPGVQVTELEKSDYPFVYAELLKGNSKLSLDALGLQEGGCQVEKAEQNYARLGLSRKRKCFTAKSGGNIVGFGFADISSYGISLSLLFNTFSVYCFEESRKKDVYAALAAEINRELKACGKTYSIAIIKPVDRQLFMDLQYKYARSYFRFVNHGDNLAETYDFLNTGRKPETKEHQ